MPNWTSPPNEQYDSETGETYSYEKYNPWDKDSVKVTHHNDGGRTYHIGGMAGDAYVDRNGNA